MKFFQNTAYKKGRPGMARVLWAPVDSLLSFPTLPAPGTGTNAGDTSIAIGDFVFKQNSAGFIDLFNDLYKGSELDFKSNGDDSSPGLMTSGKARTNGFTPQIIEFYRDVVGIPGVFLVQEGDCNSNVWWAVGCDCNPAFLVFDGKSGTKGGSEAKAISYEFKCHREPYQYQGTRTLASYIILNLSIF